MDLTLTEKLFLEASPGEYRLKLQEDFVNIRTHPLAAFVNAWNNVSPAMKTDSELAANLLSGFLLGIALAEAQRREPEVVKVMEAYLNGRARERGDHVIDFTLARAGRVRHD